MVGIISYPKQLTRIIQWQWFLSNILIDNTIWWYQENDKNPLVILSLKNPSLDSIRLSQLLKNLIICKQKILYLQVTGSL